MCSYDDDPSMHEREAVMTDLPRTDAERDATRTQSDRDFCPVCDHPYRAHSTEAGARIAYQKGYPYVPCIEPRGERSPAIVMMRDLRNGVCGCREMAPDPIRRPTAGHI